MTGREPRRVALAQQPGRAHASTRTHGALARHGRFALLAGFAPVGRFALLGALVLLGTRSARAETAASGSSPPDSRPVPLEVYGRLPHIEDVALSPDGTRIAFVRTEGESRVIAIVSLSGHTMVGGLRMGDAKLRAIEWADNDDLMLTTSATGPPWGMRGREQEWRLLDIYNVRRHSVRHVCSTWCPAAS
jgi:hypothetical protein